MDINILQKNLERLYENSEEYIQTQTESMVMQYTHAMINHKLNYFITEYVKQNFERMMDIIWQKQFTKMNVLKRIEAEIDCSLTQNIDTYASRIFNQYLHEELKKKAKAVAKQMEVV